MFGKMIPAGRGQPEPRSAQRRALAPREDRQRDRGGAPTAAEAGISSSAAKADNAGRDLVGAIARRDPASPSSVPITLGLDWPSPGLRADPRTHCPTVILTSPRQTEGHSKTPSPAPTATCMKPVDFSSSRQCGPATWDLFGCY